MEFSAQNYLKFLLGVAVGALFIWIGVTGRLGSLLGAIITPGAMGEGVRGASGSFGGSTAHTTANGTITPAQIAQYAYSAGVTSGTNALAIAVAVALAESGGNTQATHNNTNGSTDYGLWQINSVHKQFSISKLLDPAYNASAMAQISGNGLNWTAWTTYNSGAYQKYMSQGQQAASQVVVTSLGA